jgi:hypothetical protein
MDSPRPLYDDLEEDFPHRELLYASDKIMTSLSCLKWEDLMKTPLTIGLPCLISFTPGKKSNAIGLPTGSLWGVLMEFTVFGPRKRPKADGVVFICGDQKNKPDVENMPYNVLWKWALDTNNCPEDLRHSSLAKALQTLCYAETAPYLCYSGRQDGYISGLRSWKVCEWNMNFERILQADVPFFATDTLTKIQRPPKIRRTRKKRKKPDAQDPVKFMETYDFKSLDLSVISPYEP